MLRRIFAALLFLPVFASPALAQTDPLSYTEKTLTHFVHDYANVISAPTEAQLEQELNSYAQKTDHTIVVATVPSLNGESEQEFATALFKKWKIGRADVDNGLLVLVAPNEHAIKIEVGYGLEGALTDLTTAHIAQNIMAPAFKAGDYDTGIREGVAALEKAAESESVTTPEETQEDRTAMLAIGFGFLLFGALSILFLVDNRKHVWPSAILGGVFGAGDGIALAALGWSNTTIAIFGIGGAIAGYLFGRWLKKIKFDPSKYRIYGGDMGGIGGSSSGGGFSGHSGGMSGGGGGGAKW